MIPKRSTLDPKKGIRRQGVYNDQVTPNSTNFETNPTYLADDMNNIFSAIRRALTSGSGNWWDVITSDRGGAAAGLNEIVNKRIIRRLGFTSAASPKTVSAANFWTGTILPDKSMAIDGEATEENINAYVAAVTDATLANNFSVDEDSNIINNVSVIQATDGQPPQTTDGYTVHGALTCLTGALDSSAVTIKFYYVDPTDGVKYAATLDGTYLFSLPFQDGLLSAPKSIFLQPGGSAGMEIQDMFADGVKYKGVSTGATTIGDAMMLDSGTGQVVPFVQTTEANEGKFLGIAETAVSGGSVVSVVVIGQATMLAGSGFNPGDPVYASGSAGLAKTAPISGLMTSVGLAISDSELMVMPQPKKDEGYIFDNSLKILLATQIASLLMNGTIDLGSNDIYNGTMGASGQMTSVATAQLDVNGDSITSIKDEDNMVSDLDTALATQQSIKAYVDTEILAGVLILPYVTKTADYSMVAGEHTIYADATSNTVDTTIPDAALNPGREVTVHAIDISFTNRILSAGGSLDGVASITFMSAGDSYTFRSDATNWRIH